jgi:hypothetical protein
MNDAEKALLHRAINSLKVNDVYLRSSHALIAEDYDPKYGDERDNIAVQFKHVVSRSFIVELTNSDAGEKLFRVFIDFGARLIVPGSAADDESEEEQEPDVKAVIESVMVAEYLMVDDPGTEALKMFAFNNASYHVWPYWREFLSAQCLRMNLPKIMTPAVQFAANRDEADD